MLGPDRLSAGELCALTGLSRKALRVYERHGMLRPAGVDGGTGYRVYTSGQVRLGRLLQGLRECQVPVALMKSVVTAWEHAGPRAAADLVRGFEGARDADLWERRRTLHDVLRRLSADEAPPQRGADVVAVVDVPAGRELTTVRLCSAEQVPTEGTSVWHDLELSAALAPDRAVAAGRTCFARYLEPVTSHLAGRVEFGVVLADLLDPPTGWSLTRRPAHRRAVVTLGGPSPAGYPAILSALEVLSGFLVRAGADPTASAPLTRFAAGFTARVEAVEWPVRRTAGGRPSG